MISVISITPHNAMFEVSPEPTEQCSCLPFRFTATYHVTRGPEYDDLEVTSVPKHLDAWWADNHEALDDALLLAWEAHYA